MTIRVTTLSVLTISIMKLAIMTHSIMLNAIYVKCHLCAGVQIRPLSWVSLCWMSWRPQPELTLHNTWRKNNENNTKFIRNVKGHTQLFKCHTQNKCHTPCSHQINHTAKIPLIREYYRGKYHCTVDLLFDLFELACFANKNKNCQLLHSWFKTSETGGQPYSDTSPFSIPCLN